MNRNVPSGNYSSFLVVNLLEIISQKLTISQNNARYNSWIEKWIESLKAKNMKKSNLDKLVNFL